MRKISLQHRVKFGYLRLRPRHVHKSVVSCISYWIFSALSSGTIGASCCEEIHNNDTCNYDLCDWPDEVCDFDSGVCECSPLSLDCGEPSWISEK